MGVSVNLQTGLPKLLTV